ncbi:uncharacterized protein B0J16DRAFT_122994 [Fusarium flagelliforme]|uniref:uncharacterized protein n=1 Tax=Fusarium flagelliforme TaxID=2675880 RepID=UPI001E8E29E3|nr:uncharacterized protein B0J16DRAFT_122994 [Fusarium flagelliforme]KAH7184861.1 hypothetical protein B0J16DRAFT_122994 [Fusarium flagelliforme]
MALQRLAAILAVAALGVTVNASPCKPHSSAVLSSTISLGSTTVFQETVSSTMTADITDTTDVLDTTVTETAASTDTTDVLETTITESAVSTGTTDVFETTITETATDTTATVEPTVTADDVTALLTSTVATEEATTAEPTTTTAAVQPPVCVETQVLANPSFDDNSNASPWVLGAGASVSYINPRSAPSFIYNTFTQARKTSTISQSFDGVTGFTYRLEYFFNLQTAIQGRGFNCMVTPSINSRQLPHSATLTDSGPYGFRYHQTYFDLESNGPATLTFTVECGGSFNTIIIGLDDVALTKVCFRAE